MRPCIVKVDQNASSLIENAVDSSNLAVEVSGVVKCSVVDDNIISTFWKYGCLIRIKLIVTKREVI